MSPEQHQCGSVRTFFKLITASVHLLVSLAMSTRTSMRVCQDIFKLITLHVSPFVGQSGHVHQNNIDAGLSGHYEFVTLHVSPFVGQSGRVHQNNVDAGLRKRYFQNLLLFKFVHPSVSPSVGPSVGQSVQLYV